MWRLEGEAREQVRVTRIQAQDCLSYNVLDLAVGEAITTVAGPNSAGKSNLGVCVDLVRTVVGRYANSLEYDQLRDFESAGYDESPAFRVSLGIVLDQPWERDAIADFVRACLAYGGQSRPREPGRITSA